MPPAPSRRRWFRISLRTVLLLVTLLCIWLGIKVNQARRQKEAIAALKSIKSHIAFYHQLDDEGRVNYRDEPSIPAWLRQITGDDFFQRVWAVSGGDAAFTDEYAARLSAFDHLTWLRIVDSPAGDESLATIGNTESLETVQIINTPVGDRFMHRLAQAKQLQHLELQSTQVTSDGFAKLPTFAS
jgi:hypothetical protein